MASNRHHSSSLLFILLVAALTLLTPSTAASVVVRQNSTAAPPSPSPASEPTSPSPASAPTSPSPASAPTSPSPASETPSLLPSQSLKSKQAKRSRHAPAPESPATPSPAPESPATPSPAPESPATPSAPPESPATSSPQNDAVADVLPQRLTLADLPTAVTRRQPLTLADLPTANALPQRLTLAKPFKRYRNRKMKLPEENKPPASLHTTAVSGFDEFLYFAKVLGILYGAWTVVPALWQLICHLLKLIDLVKYTDQYMRPREGKPYCIYRNMVAGFVPWPVFTDKDNETAEDNGTAAANADPDEVKVHGT